jgi:hypothetical protein
MNDQFEAPPVDFGRFFVVAVLWEGILKLVKGWQSVILGVWAAPGAPETQKAGGFAPHLLQGSPGPPPGRPDPQMTEFKPLTN